MHSPFLKLDKQEYGMCGYCRCSTLSIVVLNASVSAKIVRHFLLLIPWMNLPAINVGAPMLFNEHRNICSNNGAGKATYPIWKINGINIMSSDIK